MHFIPFLDPHAAGRSVKNSFRQIGIVMLCIAVPVVVLHLPADYPIALDRTTMYAEADEAHKVFAEEKDWDKQYQLYTITYIPAFGLIVSIEEAELLPAVQAIEMSHQQRGLQAKRE